MVNARVLLVCFACAPERGSEPGIGFGFVRHIPALVRSCVVMTPTHNRHLIESGPPLPGNVVLEYVDAPVIPVPGGKYVSYLYWQTRSLRLARLLHAAEPFDLVHHVTYGMSWLPPLVGRLGPSLIWNAGNTLTTPIKFLAAARLSPFGSELLRNLAVTLGPRVSRRLVTESVMLLLGHESKDRRARPLFVSALELTEAQSLNARGGELQESDSFTVVSVGRLLYLKGMHLALHAFAKAAAGRMGWRYVILGSGPEEVALKRLAERLGIGDCVHFLGWRPRHNVLEILRSADVFCLPSLHDSSGAVFLEAMASRLPVICLDRGGPALLVDKHVGMKIPVVHPEQVVGDLAKAFTGLADDCRRRMQMGEAARRLVLERHIWDVRAREVAGLYEQVLGLPRSGHANPEEGKQ